MEQCSKETCCSQEHVCHEKNVCHEKEGTCSNGDWFLEVADCAWTEVLKDKIKEHILSTHNDRMTELAKIVAEGNNQRWQHKLAKKHACAEFKEKLLRFFSKK